MVSELVRSPWQNPRAAPRPGEKPSPGNPGPYHVRANERRPRTRSLLVATLIDGKAIARNIRTRVQIDVQRLAGPPPHLVSLGLGDDLISAVYMRNQRKACEGAGIQFTNEQLPADVPEATLIERIREMNEDPSVTGIIVQRPLR